MNLRKMIYKPLPNVTTLIDTIYFNGVLYNILEDEDDYCEWSCFNCDANTNRISNNRYMNGGMCPDSDPDIDWHCCGSNGESRVLNKSKNKG